MNVSFSELLTKAVGSRRELVDTRRGRSRGGELYPRERKKFWGARSLV